MNETYRQSTKNAARHLMIRRAVELLTTRRSLSCCVRQSYVRDIYDYFIQQDESYEKIQAQLIDSSYIRAWEDMHIQKQGYKRASDLSVCYLSGPEPNNDFNEFLTMGVLPQNIWAFECESSVYAQALNDVMSNDYRQPKIIKTSIERFFENTPKKFDIVYIDSCASLISDQHALKCISTMFMHHRLESPGILISNFCEVNNSVDKSAYIDLISKYFCVKNNHSVLVDRKGDVTFSKEYEDMYREVESNFDEFYGDFITLMICNSGSITIPTLRFVNSPYLSCVSKTDPDKCREVSLDDINLLKNNDLYKYIQINKLIEQMRTRCPKAPKVNKLFLELSGHRSGGYDLHSCFNKLYEVRIKGKDIPSVLDPILNFFMNTNKMYQFLDRPNRLLFFDSVINQLSYPMHYCSENIYRISYVAKKKKMFNDLILFDECRYIYDWLPAIHQIESAFSNLSWQYTFRFALDGLVKQRMGNNNEFFFQGSVVSKEVDGFRSQKIGKREIIS